MRRTLRVVLDTSTLVSGIIGGISAEVIDLLREGAFPSGIFPLGLAWPLS